METAWAVECLIYLREQYNFNWYDLAENHQTNEGFSKPFFF